MMSMTFKNRVAVVLILAAYSLLFVGAYLVWRLFIYCVKSLLEQGYYLPLFIGFLAIALSIGVFQRVRGQK